MARRRRRYEARDRFRTETFLDDLAGYRGFRRWDLPPESVRTAFADEPPSSLPEAVRLVYRAYARANGKHRYGDKTPIHVLNVGLLAELFPESRFVHVLRDGRDVACSYLQQDFGPRTSAEAAFRWKRAVRAGRRSGQALEGGRYTEVRYERLVTDPEETLRAVSAFAELTFDTAMLDYHRSDRVPAERPHYRSVGRPPTPGLRDWRREMRRGDLVVFEALAGDLLDELGYERGVPRIGAAGRVAAAAAWAGVQARRAGHRVAKLLSRPPSDAAADGSPG
jgi:hypothetical protein